MIVVALPYQHGGATMHDWWYDHQRPICDHLRVWNRILHVLNMTIDLAATDFPLAITRDLCDQSCVLSTICLRFHFLGRNLFVSPA